MSDVTFSDEWAYRPPEQPDCLLVPEVQWEELHTNLKSASVTKDAALWCLCGICGGGMLRCFVTFFSYPEVTQATLAAQIKHFVFLGIAILLLIATVVVALLALRFASATTAGEVRGQMSVLKSGFRRLRAEGTPVDSEETEQKGGEATS